MSTFDKILKYCKDNNISIAALEKKAGIGNGVIAEWGKDSMPSVASLKKIAEATGTKVSDWV